MSFTARPFAELINEAVADSDEVEARSYSGRAMYGHRCLAITGTHQACLELLKQVHNIALSELFDLAIDAPDDGDADANDAYAARDWVTDIVDSMLSYQTDSMGFEIVLYWPNEEYVDPAAEEAEAEEDEDN
jgi:hypothetical protein